MTESSNPTRLVGFFDILGTSEMVRSGRFGDTIALDFVNAAGLAARFLPTVHVAAFSDSVVIAADVGEVVAFLTCVTFVHRQWFADWIVVRGGIATDSLRWAEFDRLERFFSDLPNFRYARIYGTGLVKAVELEKQHGPGAITYLSKQAAEMVSAAFSDAVYTAHARMLVWAGRRGVESHAHHYRSLANSVDPDSSVGRHALATAWYFGELRATGGHLDSSRPIDVPGLHEIQT